MRVLTHIKDCDLYYLLLESLFKSVLIFAPVRFISIHIALTFNYQGHKVCYIWCTLRYLTGRHFFFLFNGLSFEISPSCISLISLVTSSPRNRHLQRQYMAFVFLARTTISFNNSPQFAYPLAICITNYIKTNSLVCNIQCISPRLEDSFYSSFLNLSSCIHKFSVLLFSGFLFRLPSNPFPSVQVFFKYAQNLCLSFAILINANTRSCYRKLRVISQNFIISQHLPDIITHDLTFSLYCILSTAREQPKPLSITQ